jgi:hypothetical protein
MSAISRRRFLRDASLGAAAVGTVAVVGNSAFGVATAKSSAAAPLSSPALSSDRDLGTSRMPGTEVMAHIVDDPSGTISLYAGTTKVTFQDRALTEALLKAVQ